MKTVATFDVTDGEVRRSIDVGFTHEAKVQLKLDDGEWVQPTIGQTVNWGEGVEGPTIMVTLDKPNPRKDAYNIRLCVFGKHRFADGTNENWVQGVEPPAKPEEPFAKLGEMGDHPEHAPTGTEPVGSGNTDMCPC